MSIYEISSTGTGLLDTGVSASWGIDFATVTGNWGKAEINAGNGWLLGWAAKPLVCASNDAYAYVCDVAAITTAAHITGSDIDFFRFSADTQMYNTYFEFPIRIYNGLWVGVNLGNNSNRLEVTVYWGT